MEIVIYHNFVPKVGGIESAVYNLASGLDSEGYGVTILYSSAESQESIFKYATVADVVKVTPELVLECDTALIASNHKIPKQLKAKRYLQWVHSDYEKYNLDLYNTDIAEFISVTQHCADVIKEREGVESKVIYNLIAEDFGQDDRPVLRLVTNSRVSPEKGFDRMLVLAEKLVSENVRFVWTVYGDNSQRPKEYEDVIRKFKHIEQVQFVGYKSDITIGLTSADYLVQLSDWEGCPLSVLEALKMGVPCIVTDWGGVSELIEDKVNGHILPMSMNIDRRHIDKIVDQKPEFEYEPLSTAKDWVKILERK